MGGKRNTPKGTLLDPAGGVVGPPPGDPLCAAYEAGLGDWCDAKKQGKPPGDFNDRVFSRLNDPSLAANRELPIGIVDKADGALGFVTRGAASGPLGEAGDYVAKMLANAGALGADGLSTGLFRLTGGSVVRKNLRGSFDVKRVLFPDTQRGRPGTPIEIKRPTEGESHPGQLRNYAKASPDGTCQLVNCEGCNLACKEWGSDCPPEG